VVDDRDQGLLVRDNRRQVIEVDGQSATGRGGVRGGAARDGRVDVELPTDQLHPAGLDSARQQEAVDDSG
jgi:hypothetical protein